MNAQWFILCFRRALEQKDEQPNLGLGFSHVYITAEEQKVLAKQIYDLLKPYENRRGIEGEQEMMDFMAFYPYVPSDLEASQGVSLSPHRTWAIGAVDFSRADLEKALAEGESAS